MARLARAHGQVRFRGAVPGAFANLSLVLAMVAGSGAAAGQEQPQARSGLMEGARWGLLHRSIYERRDFRNGDTSNGGRNIALPRSQRSRYAEEWGYGLIGTVESGFTSGLLGLGVDAHVHLAGNLAGDDYRVGKIRMLPLDTSGYAQDHIARGGAALKARLSSTILRVGEHRVTTPVFNASDSRLLPEAMRGWLLSSNEIADLVLHAGRFSRSTDRQARATGNPLIVNYLNPSSPRGKVFDLAGGTWKGIPDLALSAYLGRLQDTWRTNYFGVQYKIPLQEKQSLALSLQV